MKKNKMVGYVMTGALSLGLIGGGVHAFAATSSTAKTTTSAEQAVNVKASMSTETKQKVQAIMDELKSKLSDLGVQLPEKGGKHGGGPGHGDLFANLDAATKTKAQAILDQERAGTITHEQAKTKLTALGVTLPERDGDHGPGHGDLFANLDAATKTKAQAILDQERAGTITHEQAKTKLTALGVTLPERGGDPLANLDAATKAKAQTLIDEAKAKLAKLGVDHLPFGRF